MQRLTVFLLIAFVVGAIFAVMIFNGLVYKRNRVRNAFSGIDVNLRKRHDLIPTLVETVKGYASHEKETFRQLVEARQRIEKGGLSESERLQLEESIGPRMQRLVAVAENYPELRSSEHFLNLQRNLTEVEEQISASWRAYNSAVFDINNAVESFPSNFVASTFGFKRHDFFEITNDQRDPVDVDPRD